MNQMIYKCLDEKCGCEFKNISKDGLGCPICKNVITPLKIKPTRLELSKVPTYKELKVTPMVNKKEWKEFRECGLLWWINTMLHTFGWAIVVEVEDGIIINAYPCRVKFRGFDEKTNTKGYMDISKFMKENAEQLEKESRE